MVDVRHDWDETDIVKQLEQAVTEYITACYGGRERISDLQFTEVRQAFLSGIHWLNTQPDYCPDDNEMALRAMLNLPRQFPQLKAGPE